MAQAKTGKTIRVRQIRGLAGITPSQRKNMHGLGLKKIRQERVYEDTPAIRGMLKIVHHLVEVVE
jgi:large subunit ribosomal protein L30